MKDSNKQLFWWLGALALGVILGILRWQPVLAVCDFIATVYTRLFQFLAIPTVALAILTTLIGFGGGAIKAEGSFLDHIISVFPDNILQPLLSGNVLSILLIAAAFGLAICFMPDSERKSVLVNGIEGLQDVFYTLIRALIKTLPLGIVAFAAQLSSQLAGGLILGSLGRWAAVILIGNLVQFAVVLPLILLLRGLNPLKVFRAMSPAVVMALFTKSSAATLPVTLSSAENRLGADPKVARFVLPICTTINMNGCAAFILVTSLFVMSCGGMDLSIWQMLLWVLISVIAAVGNAGVPMGCFFLTLSLMTGIGAPVEVMGLILPIYTVVDMVETAENVWSDSCVCAMTDKDLREVKE